MYGQKPFSMENFHVQVETYILIFNFSRLYLWILQIKTDFISRDNFEGKKSCLEHESQQRAWNIYNQVELRSSPVGA